MSFICQVEPPGRQWVGHMSLTLKEETQTGDRDSRVIRIQVIVKALKTEQITNKTVYRKRVMGLNKTVSVSVEASAKI